MYEEDAVSAGKPIADRPQAAEMFSLAKSRRRDFDGIIVIRKDRLFRDLEDELAGLRFLASHRCEFWTVDGRIDRSTPETEFMSNVLGAASQLERKLAGKRVKEHNLAMAMSGKIPGSGMPLGLHYNKDTKGVDVTDRAGDVELVMRLYIETGGNGRRTAQELNRRGIVTATGGQWMATQVIRVVHNPVYRQMIAYDGYLGDGKAVIPRIVPQELTDIVDRYRTHPQPAPRAKGSKRAYSGIMRCSECGRLLWAVAPTRFTPHASWACSSSRQRGLCGCAVISEQYIDHMVGTALRELLMIYSGEIAAAANREGQSVDRTAQRREKLLLTRSRWHHLYASGDVEYAEMQREVKAIDRDLAGLGQKQERTYLAPETVKHLIAQVGDRWREIPAEGKKHLLRLINARIVVHGVGDQFIELETSLMEQPVTAYRGDWKYRRQRVKGFYTSTDICEIFGISSGAIRWRMHTGKLPRPVDTLDKRRLWSVEEIDRIRPDKPDNVVT